MSEADMDKAVILARGLGTRMRKADEAADLTDAEHAAAQTGVKAMIPIARPFLDYVLAGLADAGYRRVCLVIGPEHDAMRDYYGSLDCTRLAVEFAVQLEPLGTADAVAAAEDFAGGEAILVVNSDNYYPTEALRGLRVMGGSALAAFDRDALLDGSNIPPDRISRFAVVLCAPDGTMARILEKPDPQTLQSLEGPIRLSMNCWRFAPAIFEACRNISPSPRGELEITDAVQYAIDTLGESFGVLPVSAGVLDLSSRSDIVAVREALAGVEVRL